MAVAGPRRPAAPRAMVISPRGSWPLRSRQELQANSPTSPDQLSVKIQGKWVSGTVRIMRQAGGTLNLAEETIETAQTFVHRFFSLRSLKKNDRFLMGMAALLLAAKCRDQARALNDVIRHFWRWRCQKIKRFAEEANYLDDLEFLDDVRDNVLLAEQTMLFTFNFHIQSTPSFPILTRAFSSFSQTGDPGCNAYWAGAADLYKDSDDAVKASHELNVCLQYEPCVIAAACIVFVLESWAVPVQVDSLPLVPAGAWEPAIGGQGGWPLTACPFYEAMCPGMRVELAELRSCAAQLTVLYHPTQQPDSPSAPAASAGSPAADPGPPAAAPAANGVAKKARRQAPEIKQEVLGREIKTEAEAEEKYQPTGQLDYQPTAPVPGWWSGSANGGRHPPPEDGRKVTELKAAGAPAANGAAKQPRHTLPEVKIEVKSEDQSTQLAAAGQLESGGSVKAGEEESACSLPEPAADLLLCESPECSKGPAEARGGRLCLPCSPELGLSWSWPEHFGPECGLAAQAEPG